MDDKNESMIRNEKAEFAVKILLEYAKENGINGRDTTDLSPLEEWLILRLYNVVWRSEQLKAFADYAQKRMWEDGDKDLSEFADEFLRL